MPKPTTITTQHVFGMSISIQFPMNMPLLANEIDNCSLWEQYWMPPIMLHDDKSPFDKRKTWRTSSREWAWVHYTLDIDPGMDVSRLPDRVYQHLDNLGIPIESVALRVTSETIMTTSLDWEE